MHNTTAIFKSREGAQAIVESMDSMTYWLAYGEYQRPHYTARKVRGMDQYYIHARRYYCAGTYNAKPSGPLMWEDKELYNR